MGDIICYNADGEALQYFTQWDVNQKLIIKGADISSSPVFHFLNANINVAYTVQSTIEGESIVVNVPDVLLQYNVPLIVFVEYEYGTTEYSIRIPIMPRVKPSDYIVTDGSGSGPGSQVTISVINDLNTQDAESALSAMQGYILNEKIKNLEDTKINDSDIDKIVNNAISDAFLNGDFELPDDNFVVTVVYDDASKSYSTNKTSQEIASAWRNETPIFCRYDNGGVPFVVTPFVVFDSKVMLVGSMLTGFGYLISIEGSTVTVQEVEGVSEEAILSKVAEYAEENYQPKGNYVTEEAAEQILEDYAKKDEIPKSMSQLSNNVGYARKAELLSSNDVIVSEVIIPQTTFTTDGSDIIAISEEVPALIAGETYAVNWNGTEYICAAFQLTDIDDTEEVDMVIIGNSGISTGNVDESGEPFAIARVPDDAAVQEGFYAIIFVLDGSTSVTLSIDKVDVNYKIKEELLPDNLGSGGSVDLSITGATSGQTAIVSSVDENGAPTAWDAVDRVGRSGTSVSSEIFNDYENNKASSLYSHAEGEQTKATGRTAHAEGNYTTAGGHASHAEGFSSKTVGSYCHAEGKSTVAYGNASHAEGNSTYAYGDGVHVQGRYNSLDENNVTVAHVVGNGTNEANRSNAHTLEWDGTAWYASDVYVGGANRIDGERLAKVSELTGYATEEWVKNKIAQAELDGGDVDLSGYAQKSELPTKVSQLQNDSGYLTEHQDISGKLDASKLPTVINEALAQAKASGEFDGRGIISVDRTYGDGAAGSTDIYTITYSDNTTSTFNVYNGANGTDGGILPGEDGATFFPHVDSAGNLSWTNNKGLQNPKTVNIKGSDGVTPVKYVDYFDGNDYILTDADKTEIAEQAARLVDVPERSAPDWNANEGEPGHILNRPFYTETFSEEVLPEQLYDFKGPLPPTNLVVGETYIVKYNDVTYEAVAKAGSAYVELIQYDSNFMSVFEVYEDQKSGRTYVDCYGRYTEITISITKKSKPEIVHKIPEKYLPDNIGGGAQADWDAGENEPGHILNRPFYSEISTVEILPETELPFDEDMGYITEVSAIPAVDRNVTVVWNGTPYVCKVYDGSIMEPGVVAFGNLYRAIGDDAAIIDVPLVDTGEPFVIMAAEIEGSRLVVAYPLEEIQSLTMSLIAETEVVHPIPEKYIPGGVDTFTVEVTKDSPTGDWTANKTPAEIFNAHKTGKEIFCKLIYGYSSIVMLPVAVSEIGATFSTVYLDVDAPSQDYVVNSEIAITESGVTHSTTLLATRTYVQEQIASSVAGGNVELDTTLTEEGKAADAKAVGDAISKLSGGNIENGENVFSPTATITQTDSGAVISITDKTGITTANITHGKDGKDGIPCTHFWNGTVLSVTSASGTSSSNLVGPAGAEGVSIERVEQTVASDKDNGVNVVVVYLSNGESYNFEIKNGSQGGSGLDATINGVNILTLEVGRGLVQTQTGNTLSIASNYDYSTQDLVAGSSKLETGKLYFVYE